MFVKHDIQFWLYWKTVYYYFGLENYPYIFNNIKI